MASPSRSWLCRSASVLRQGIKGRHQRVALLAALSLTNFVRAAMIVEPGVDARRGTELPCVGQQRLQLPPGMQGV